MTSLPEAPAGPLLQKAPTGVAGLDEITRGGLPKGRSTLLTGGTGCGKTLLALQFLVAGAREHGEPGVLITFEESAEKLTANFASLGFDLDGLLRDGLLVSYAFRAEPTEVVGTGEFDFEPLFLLLDEAIKRSGARRVVLDSIELLFRGSTALVSGSAGTGKTTLAMHLIDAACARGERALLILYEESADEVIRNMRSVGLNLRHWAEAGLLRIWPIRPTEFGLENRLAAVAELLAEHAPAVAVADGTASPLGGPAHDEVASMLARTFYLFKSRGVTAMATILTENHADSAIGVSSRADAWLLLRNIESDGERNRLLFVRKQRGSANSNQVREFVLTDHGPEIVDVYVGPAGVLTGSARLAQESRERDAGLQQQQDLQRRTRELRRGIAHGQTQLTALQDELAAQQAELEWIAGREQHRAADGQAARLAMSTQRRADPAGRDDEAPR